MDCQGLIKESRISLRSHGGSDDTGRVLWLCTGKGGTTERLRAESSDAL